jgi:integrase
MEEAEAKAALMRVKRQNEGASSFAMLASTRTDAEVALGLLASHGKTLKEAAEFLIANIDLIKESKTVRQVVDELLDFKEKNKRAPRYLKDLKSKLSNGFAARFGERVIYTVSARELQDYVYGLEGVEGITRNNYQAALSVLFGFARKRKYTLLNPALEIEQAAVEASKPGILTVAEVSALMQHAVVELIPALALSCFGGLRPESEVWRLDWSHINFEDLQHGIDIQKSKNVASHRFVRVSPNLLAWLKPYAKKRGPVSPTGDAYYWRLQKSREAAADALKQAGFDASSLLDWKQDCLRHSFCSYHFAMHKNAGDTAEQIGHGGKLGVFFRHYRNRVRQGDAANFWQIYPVAAS